MAKLKTQLLTCHECGGKGAVAHYLPRSLTEAREAAGLSMKQLADKAKLSAGYVSDVERGYRPLRAGMKLAATYEALAK